MKLIRYKSIFTIIIILFIFVFVSKYYSNSEGFGTTCSPTPTHPAVLALQQYQPIFTSDPNVKHFTDNISTHLPPNIMAICDKIMVSANLYTYNNNIPSFLLNNMDGRALDSAWNSMSTAYNRSSNQDPVLLQLSTDLMNIQSLPEYATLNSRALAAKQITGLTECDQQILNNHLNGITAYQMLNILFTRYPIYRCYHSGASIGGNGSRCCSGRSNKNLSGAGAGLYKCIGG